MLFRDAFAERLRLKDEASTRHLAEATPAQQKAFEEAAKRLKLEKEDRSKVLPTLRIDSRRKYLVKRKDDKLKELAGDIADEEYLFDEETLTEKEKKRLEYKKTVLKLATDYDKVGCSTQVQKNCSEACY
ncbi:hypothetical protein HAZT_HAZT010229 [Hyalella azteca]|uniref:Uncharacterized protein n=1 Tax=Hyalella azteca TaxID=294128 RepID=A0A6A0H941_HYAAZ|nr:hypothetical protein HAZT_HAZT010229 [Hyalella azteca]